ncbi:MAG: HAMP domain-containing sensor histidine kinase, partial [Bacteroidota bacterium]
VTDEGPGFKEEEKHLIFKKFAKLSAKPTGGEIAAGLGLYQAHKCVRALGGEITVEDNPPQGAKVTIIVPNA